MLVGLLEKAVARALGIATTAIREVRIMKYVYLVIFTKGVRRPAFVGKNAVAMAIAEACETSVFAIMSGAGRLVRHSQQWAVYEAPINITALLLTTLKVVFDGVFYNQQENLIGVRTVEIV
jgi:hypothetical protein